MTFLDKLDLLMQCSGLNRNKLSIMSGVPYTTIDGFYKKGYENAKISTLKKIAKALGCSLDYLIEPDVDQLAIGSICTNGERTESMLDLSPEERKAVELMRTNSDARAQIMLVMEMHKKDTPKE